MLSSPHLTESRFWNPRNLCLWNPESGALEPGIQLKESRIPLPIGIQNPRLSWISFYGVWHNFFGFNMFRSKTLRKTTAIIRH